MDVFPLLNVTEPLSSFVEEAGAGAAGKML